MRKIESAQYTVQTFDGKTYRVTAFKTGVVTWRAWTQVDGQHVEGVGGKSSDEAIERWKEAYQRRFES